MLLLLLACRPPTELNPAAAAGTGYHLDGAIADIASISLRDCVYPKKDETVTTHQRFSLLQPAPIRVKDREWCGLKLVFRSTGMRLDGSVLDAENKVLNFHYFLNPGTMDVDTRFLGKGEELVVVLDPDQVVETAPILKAAADRAAAGTPVDSLSWDAESPESAALVKRLPEAFWVGTVTEAADHFGSRWHYEETVFRREAVRSGCGTVTVDTSWDTNIYLGVTDTGTRPTSGETGKDTVDSPVDSHTVESRVLDSRADSRRDSGIGRGGCACTGSGAESSTESSTTSPTESTIAESHVDSGDSGSSSSFCACGGGGESSALAAPPAAFAFFGFFWMRRRQF